MKVPSLRLGFLICVMEVEARRPRMAAEGMIGANKKKSVCHVLAPLRAPLPPVPPAPACSPWSLGAAKPPHLGGRWARSPGTEARVTADAAAGTSREVPSHGSEARGPEASVFVRPPLPRVLRPSCQDARYWTSAPFP